MEKEYKPKKQLYNNNIITLHNLYITLQNK
jgi:hypothetical protein